jgi:hypothetical protein
MIQRGRIVTNARVRFGGDFRTFRGTFRGRFGEMPQTKVLCTTTVWPLCFTW